VDVRILIPNQPDQGLVYLAGFHFESELKSLGIRVHRDTDGFLHQKCVLVDDRLALVGSTNLDNRSRYLNFEIMIAIEQTDFVREVAEMFQSDFCTATETSTNPPRLRPWYVPGTAGQEPCWQNCLVRYSERHSNFAHHILRSCGGGAFDACSFPRVAIPTVRANQVA